MSKYNKSSHYMVIFLGLFLLLGGIGLPLRYPNSFDTLASGIVLVVIGLATLVIFGPKSFWVSGNR